jgi:hypothetical protein
MIPISIVQKVGHFGNRKLAREEHSLRPANDIYYGHIIPKEEEMENPIGISPEPPPPQKKKGWVIAAIVAGVLVCCICLVAIGVGIYLYTNNQSVDVVGTWQLSFDWDCTGQGQPGSFTFRPDGTFTDGGGSVGNYTLSGTQITLRYDNGTTYTGTVSGTTMSGEMVAFDGATGCWTATKQNP